MFLKIRLTYEQDLNSGILLKTQKLLHDHCSGLPCIKG